VVREDKTRDRWPENEGRQRVRSLASLADGQHFSTTEPKHAAEGTGTAGKRKGVQQDVKTASKGKAKEQLMP